MPSSYWSHSCLRAGALSDSPTCPYCGAEGSFVRWSLRMHEAMARYQYLYGLVPVGRHKRLANQLFSSSRRDCGRCGGEGVLTVDESSWLMCRDCEGTGGFWTISEDEVEAIRARILAGFPDAGDSGRPTAFLSGPLIQNLRTGEMLGPPKRGDEGPGAASPPGSGDGEAETGGSS
jgi:hypothetical protein